MLVSTRKRHSKLLRDNILAEVPAADSSRSPYDGSRKRSTGNNVVLAKRELARVARKR